MTTTTITGSLRKVSGKTKQCLNFRKEHVAALNLSTNRHAEITCNPDRTVYTLKFFPKQTCRSTAVTVSKGGAKMVIDPTRFKITQLDPTTTNTMQATYLPDGKGVAFNFNLEEFVKPTEERLTEATTTHVIINTAEDKEKAGFEPASSWGVAFQEKVDAKIQDAMLSYLKAKLGMMNVKS